MLIYVEGPGDIVALHKKYSLDPTLPNMHTVPFSAQVFDACTAAKQECLAISTCGNSALFKHQHITSTNIPRQRSNYAGIRYHLAGIIFSLRIFAMALQKHADYLLISNATIPWYMLWLFVPVCNQIICIHHNTLWPLQKRSNSIFARFVSILDAIFLKKCADAHLVVSERIAQQLSVKGIATPATITRFKPLFNATVFRQPAHEKPRRKGELHLLYSGRIERDKGVLDLLMAMNWLRQHTDCQIRLVIAGTGSFEQAARDFCKESGIDSQVIFTGQISGEILQRHYAEADLLVAPTQSTFSEGYAMVIPEAILAGTGAIASTVVPAADDFSACILTVEADNYDMLGKTILSTINTENHHVLSMHTMTYRDTILDASKSLRNIVGRTLRTKDIQV